MLVLPLSMLVWYIRLVDKTFTTIIANLKKYKFREACKASEALEMFGHINHLVFKFFVIK